MKERVEAALNDVRPSLQADGGHGDVSGPEPVGKGGVFLFPPIKVSHSPARYIPVVYKAVPPWVFASQ